MQRDETFSFTRALKYLAAPAAGGADVERAASRDLAGGRSRGLAVPGADLARALDATSGGALVGETTDGFAGALRAAMVLGRAGATLLTDLRGDVSVPTITDGAAAFWLSDGGTVAPSTPATAPGAITPATIAAAVPVSRRLLLQGAPAVAAVIAADLIAALAHELDAAALGASSDANAPPGLRQALAGDKVTFTGATPSAAEVFALERAALDGQAGDGALAFIAAPGLMAELKATEIVAGGPMIANAGQIAGRPALITPAWPAGELLCGGFDQLIIAHWGGVDLRLDAGTGAAADTRILRAFVDVGFLTRRTGSFGFGGAA